MTTVLQARPRNFVSTPAIERLTIRALRYLQSGYSIHLKGAAGTGKTTLGLHLADLLGRPIMLLFGDDEFKTSDLIGNQSGYTRKKVVDNFIHSVVKVEDELRHNWVDSRLTLACREGFTMVYDEFNRSRPEVNNVLLSALEEKLLVLPPSGNRPEYIRVSPHFRAIFTSNPEEYCGVHGTQDALLDRVITINMPEPDELTQQQILVQKVGIDSAAALLVVRIVRALQASVETDMVSSLRPSLMIATICLQHDIPILAENPDFRDVCSDILLTRSGLPPAEATQLMWGIFNDFIVAQATAAPAIVDLNAIVGEAKLSGEGVEAQPEEYIQDVEVEDRTSSAIAVTAKDAALPDSESPTTEVDIQDAVKSDSVADTIPHQAEVLDFLMQRESARLVEIENALSLNRFQVVNILRLLIDAGLITKQESAGKPSIYTFEAAQTPE
ncbi:MAG: gas vesicle protein GvpN [Cyanobacteria bacterium P01_A01_bin.123]